MRDQDGSYEEWLAQPDTVRLNEAERRRYLERKRREEAEEQRERNSKAEGDPTVEELVADMIRVAESEELNPMGFRDRTLTRKRYKRFGSWYIEHVEHEFGTFEHAKEVAGLNDKIGTRQLKFARAAQSRREHAGRYQERFFLPFRFDPTAREAKDVELMLSISDTHATFLDPFVWHCFLIACAEMDPDYIYLNGDILEGSQISRHPKIPGWSVPLALEFEFARTMFEQLRQVCPDAVIIWGSGNHGLDRIAMYLTQVAPALSGLPSLRFDKLAGIDDLDIKLAQQGTIASPKDQEDDIPGTLFHGFYTVYHGTSLGQTPYLQELRAAGRSGQSGHVHRAGMAYATSEAMGAHSWMSTPMACHERAGKAYLFKKRQTGWQKGFGIAYLHPRTGRVQQYPVVTSGGFAAFEGIMVEDSLPDGQPDWRRNWLADDFKMPR